MPTSQSPIFEYENCQLLVEVTDFLEEKREQALIRIVHRQQKIGDLVLRKVI